RERLRAVTARVVVDGGVGAPGRKRTWARRSEPAGRGRSEHALAPQPGLQPRNATRMRVHIISDMEGIAGIVHPHQTNAGKPQYEEGRQLYTEEINAAVRGAKAGGATEIVVMDCHGAGEGYSWNSLIAEDLDPDCEF